MRIMSEICGNCNGRGYEVNYEIVQNNGITGLAERKESICKVCNGTGRISYAEFSVEEAEAILKICDLVTTNLHI